MSEPEVWLRGALPDIAPFLQPVAHSLLQCRLEVRATVPTLSGSELWAIPGGAASAGYHVRHAIGSLDRLFTYARGEQLSSTQLHALKGEGRSEERVGIQGSLVADFDAAVAPCGACASGVADGPTGLDKTVARTTLPRML